MKLVFKILFVPVSVATGLAAGAAGKALFGRIWALFDDQEPPEAEHRRASWAKLMAAAALQGAVFRVVKQTADHGSRIAFRNVTGFWPGEDAPEPRP